MFLTVHDKWSFCMRKAVLRGGRSVAFTYNISIFLKRRIVQFDCCNFCDIIISNVVVVDDDNNRAKQHFCW